MNLDKLFTTMKVHPKCEREKSSGETITLKNFQMLQQMLSLIGDGADNFLAVAAVLCSTRWVSPPSPASSSLPPSTFRKVSSKLVL
jgi:hypothetical protein